MRIAVDAMGGDFAPQAIVEGALLAVRECPDIECLYLVGDERAIQAEIARCGGMPGRVQIRHASEAIGMGESPATAVRRKKDSSINRAVDLVKNGEADAVFAAGSTGAAVAAATLKLRTLEGIRRPGIAVVMPTPADKPMVLIDGGATPDCTPEILLQFAIMGSAFSHNVLGQPEPKVGLMSVGSEEAKGNVLSKEAFELLEQAPLRFIGKWLKRELTRNPVRLLGSLLLSGGLRTLKKKISKQTYGGAPLLGVNGICIIGHGSSDKVAAKNGIRQAAQAVKAGVNQAILEGVRQCTASAARDGGVS